MNTDTILGISPGTRSFGIAVRKHNTLLEWKVMSFPGAWDERKLRKIIGMVRMLIGQFAPDGISVKVPDSFPATLSFSQLIGSVNALCDQYGINPCYYSLFEIKARHCAGGKQNSLALMAAIAAKHPELLPHYRKELKNKETYYCKVFEAAAVTYMTP